MDNGTVITDRHARAHAVRVRRVEHPGTEEAIQAALDAAAAEGQRVSVGGQRHAMGAQPFATGLVHLDITSADRIIKLDPDAGTVTAQPGICWPALIRGIVDAQRDAPLHQQRGIRQKQTGANGLTLGGAISANAHGRGLTLAPIIGDIERFRLLRPGKPPIDCSRRHHPDLFASAIGGYGLCGVISEATLRLARRCKVRRVVREAHADEIIDRFNERIAQGYLYGDFQFDIDHTSEHFLRRGVFSCYEPVDDQTPIPPDQKLFTEPTWLELVRLARSDKPRAYRAYLEHYRATDGQIYYSDTHQLSTYTPDYPDRVNPLLPEPLRGTEMITELYVARHRLRDFLDAAASMLAERHAPVIYGTVRIAEPDEESALPWARRYTDPHHNTHGPACIIFNLLWNEPTADQRAEDFRALIDLALDMGDAATPGSFYLTYHRLARADQLRKAHPGLPAFLQRAEQGDAGTWSDWATDLHKRLRNE
ncbi:MAG: FAD-binding protein [Phycisphaerales bacterium]